MIYPAPTQPPAEPDATVADLGELSARPTRAELSVLRFMALGLTAQRVAEARGVGVRTVQTQVESLRRKVRASNAVHLMAIAFRRGWIK